MTLGRAIIVSMIAHLGVVGYGYLQPVAANSVRLEVSYDNEDRRVEIRPHDLQEALEDEQTNQSPFEGVDVTAGLTPEGDEPAEVQSEPAPEPEPTPEPTAEPAPETTETASTEPEQREQQEAPEPDETSDQRNSVVVDEDFEAPVETEDAAPTPPEPAASDGQKVATNSGAPAGGEGGTSSGGEADGTPAGDGDATGAPAGDGDGAGGGSGVDRGKLMRGYAQSIYKLIAKHRTYPKLARRAGLEGTVTVEVKINQSGRILAVGIHDSSGHQTLDDAARKTLRDIDRLPAPPEALAWSQKRLRIPIRYDLNRRG